MMPNIHGFARLIICCVIILMLFAGQLVIHLFANDPLSMLLPGDGCGQILDTRLRDFIHVSLFAAHIAAGLFSISFAVSAIYGTGASFLVVTALLAIGSFMIGGSVHLYFREHLAACDMFFLAADAPVLNLAAGGLLLMLTIANLRRMSSVARKGRSR